jgi:hypothetical protein
MCEGFGLWPQAGLSKSSEEMMASSLNIYAGMATILDEFAACTP